MKHTTEIFCSECKNVADVGEHHTIFITKLCPFHAAAPELVNELIAAIHALRSYQFGNGSPNLAESVADHAEAFLVKIEARP
jgi:hypothetical protein